MALKDIKIQYKAIIIKVFEQTDINKTRIEIPEMYSNTYKSFTCNKGGTSNQW